MSKASFMDKYVQCPYFKRFEVSQVCCEGVNGASTSRMAFRGTKEMKDYVRRVCAANWEQCPIAKGLNGFWEEELNGKK